VPVRNIIRDFITVSPVSSEIKSYSVINTRLRFYSILYGIRGCFSVSRFRRLPIYTEIAKHRKTVETNANDTQARASTTYATYVSAHGSLTCRTIRVYACKQLITRTVLLTRFVAGSNISSSITHESP